MHPQGPQRVRGRWRNTPPAAVDIPWRCEPVIGTGTGSEVVEVVREGQDSYLATTKDGCQEVVDEATLSKLPQGVARLATLQTREMMAAQQQGIGVANARVPEDDNGSTAQSTVDEPGGEPTPRALSLCSSTTDGGLWGSTLCQVGV